MKVLLVSALMLVSCMLFSQENSLKPGGGDISFEVSFYPNDPFSPINMEYLRGRFFLSNNIAVRLGIDYSTKSTQEESENIAYEYSYGNQVIAYQAPNDVFEQSFTVIGFHPGIEYHFLTENKRISPYFGGEIYFSRKFSSAKITDYNISEDYDYNSGGYIYSHTEYEYEYENSWTYGSERAYSLLGLNAIIGTDVYLTKHFFMGIEFGLGYQMVKNLEVKEKNITRNTDIVIDPENKQSNIGLYINNAIRLGFWF